MRGAFATATLMKGSLRIDLLLSGFQYVLTADIAGSEAE